MQLGEPKKIAFESDNDWTMDFWEAQGDRSDDFWNGLEKELYPYDRDDKEKRSYEKTIHVRNGLKKVILEGLTKYVDAIADEKCYRLPTDLSDLHFWQAVKFILAFNTSFKYFPEDEDGNQEEESETDYLDEETTFRFDVVTTCDRLTLEGAAFSKRIGSDSYQLWADAMIKLGNQYEEEQYKAADDIVAAMMRTWADLRTWIFMKDAHKAKKAKPKAKKAKK